MNQTIFSLVYSKLVCALDEQFLLSAGKRWVGNEGFPWVECGLCLSFIDLDCRFYMIVDLGNNECRKCW